MSHALICYLERNMLTGDLLPASSEKLADQYSIGHLYLIYHSLSPIPSDVEIQIKVSRGEFTFYDGLALSADRLLTLTYRESGLAVNYRPVSLLSRPFPFQAGLVAHQLSEMDSDFLDFLETEYDYNVLGESDWSGLVEQTDMISER